MYNAHDGGDALQVGFTKRKPTLEAKEARVA